jgi:hypothetical protein
MLFSVPPRLPNAGGVVQWQVNGHTFSIRDEGTIFSISATSPPENIAGRVFPSQKWHIGYDIHEGVQTLGTRDGQTIWKRCQGRLRFQDLSDAVRMVR